jgi:hypothetical protein
MNKEHIHKTAKLNRSAPHLTGGQRVVLARNQNKSLIGPKMDREDSFQDQLEMVKNEIEKLTNVLTKSIGTNEEQSLRDQLAQENGKLMELENVKKREDYRKLARIEEHDQELIDGDEVGGEWILDRTFKYPELDEAITFQLDLRPCTTFKYKNTANAIVTIGALSKYRTMYSLFVGYYSDNRWTEYVATPWSKRRVVKGPTTHWENEHIDIHGIVNMLSDKVLDFIKTHPTYRRRTFDNHTVDRFNDSLMFIGTADDWIAAIRSKNIIRYFRKVKGFVTNGLGVGSIE